MPSSLPFFQKIENRASIHNLNLYYTGRLRSNDPLICSVSSALDMEQKTVQDMCAGWDNLQDQN